MMLPSVFTARTWRGRSYLVSPFVDFMLAGGAPFLFFGALFLVFPESDQALLERPELFFSITFAYLAYLINDPHFIVSYELMYENFAGKLKQFRASNKWLWWRYLNAGIFVPVLLLAFFAYATYAQREEIFSWGIYALFFFVGWHYVKQSYGVLIVLSALKRSYFSPRERRILLVNSYLVWMNSWLPGQVAVPGVTPTQSYEWGIGYTDFNFLMPPYLLELLYGLLYVYGAACIIMLLLKWHREKQRPSFTGIAGYASMYILLLLSWEHPLWIYVAPMFHSLQYLLFVWSYKRGESQIAYENESWTRESGERHLKRFAAIALLGGLLLFNTLPDTLTYLTFDSSLLLPFTFMAAIFINIHHYFIDNVIWKKDNPQVGVYLFHQAEEPEK